MLHKSKGSKAYRQRPQASKDTRKPNVMGMDRPVTRRTFEALEIENPNPNKGSKPNG